MLNTDKNVFNLDTTIADRSKAFCHITGYYKRNEITFGSKIKGVVDPERALQLFSGQGEKLLSHKIQVGDFRKYKFIDQEYLE